METKEFRVRPVIRHVVTEYTNDPASRASSCGVVGEFSSEEEAEKVQMALAEQAAPREYVAVLSTFEIDAKAMYFADAAAMNDFAAQKAVDGETWRVFSRIR